MECEVVLSLLLWFWFCKRQDGKMPTAIESTTATRTHQKMQRPFKAIDLLGHFCPESWGRQLK